MAKRVLILATDGFEQSELLEPKKALEAAGIETTVASPKTGSIKGWNHTDWGESVKVDARLDAVDADDFDALPRAGLSDIGAYRADGSPTWTIAAAFKTFDEIFLGGFEP